MEGRESEKQEQASITAEEVISKLKEDGDFDKLRLKIIQKLKQNEELRNNIISTVKQSATLGRAGAENLKPRELSDAIHVEVGNEVMRQVSDALWGVIRSSDGMKSEISETVESVYNSLLTPKVQEPSPIRDPTPGDKEASNSRPLAISVCEPYSEPKETPNLPACSDQHGSVNEGEDKKALPVNSTDGRHTNGTENHHTQQVLLPSNDDPSVPPGFSVLVNSEQKCDVTEDDPDVPPGFG